MLAISFLIANLLLFFQADGELAALGSLAAPSTLIGTYRAPLQGKWQVTSSLHVACEWGATLRLEINYLLAIFPIFYSAKGGGATSPSFATQYISIAPYRASRRGPMAVNLFSTGGMLRRPLYCWKTITRFQYFPSFTAQWATWQRRPLLEQQKCRLMLLARRWKRSLQLSTFRGIRDKALYPQQTNYLFAYLLIFRVERAMRQRRSVFQLKTC